MKIYNPFKPHVVEFIDGTFAVRKSKLFWGTYKGRDADYWWVSKEYIHKHCAVDTLREAEKLLSKKSLSVKVIHG